MQKFGVEYGGRQQQCKWLVHFDEFLKNLLFHASRNGETARDGEVWRTLPCTRPASRDPAGTHAMPVGAQRQGLGDAGNPPAAPRFHAHPRPVTPAITLLTPTNRDNAHPDVVPIDTCSCIRRIVPNQVHCVHELPIL